MTKARQSLTRAEFDQLVKRAIELDEIGRERLNVNRASQIAREIGVAPEAWEEAMREFAEGAVKTADAQGVSLKRVAIAAAAGFAVGFTAGANSGPIAQLLAGGMLATAAGIVGTSARTRSVNSSTADLVAWWLAAGAGIQIGFGRTSTDALWFVGFSLAGSLVVDRAVRWVLRLRRPAKTAQTVDLT